MFRRRRRREQQVLCFICRKNKPVKGASICRSCYDTGIHMPKDSHA